MRRLILFRIHALLVGIASVLLVHAQTLIPANATWRFLDTGTNLGTAWRAPEFDDNVWSSGPAQLGFGDGDEATLINGGPSNARFRTTYFRHKFVITNLAALTNFAVRLLRDDGAVVYVNGSEVLRQNMPEGVITATTLTPIAVGNADEDTFFSEPLVTNHFVAGTNVVAVELHQSDPASSDLSFALELLANSSLGNFLPIVALDQPENGATVASGLPFVIQASASDRDGAVQSLAILRDGLVVASTAGTSIIFTNPPLGPGTHVFVARAIDSQGGIAYSTTNGVAATTLGKHLVFFPGFTTQTNLVMQHRSSSVSGRRLVLNPAGGGTGGAFIPAKQFIRDGFDVLFQYDIHDIGNGGGDGFAFVIQNNNPGVVEGLGGGAVGYGSIPNSIAIEFDTWGNPEGNDPNSNHIGVHSRGTGGNNSDETYSLGRVTSVADLNGTHTVRILYVPPVLSVFLDNTNAPVLNVTNDLSVLFPLDFGRAWMGFTASTGAGVEAHDILSWSVTTPEWIATRVVNPAPLAILNAPVASSVEATATASNGTLAKIEFYDDGVFFGESFSAPHRVMWNTTRTGWHELVAMGYDSAGHSTPSEPVRVYVHEGDGRATLVPAGSSWFHHDAGLDLGTNWVASEYNHSHWRLGRAQLGFGESDEFTRITGSGSSSRYPTIYFRREFIVTNLAAISNLTARLLRDDGAVVYLNGREALRSNMPLGPIQFSTLSESAAQGTNETNFFISEIDPALLVNGRNTLAVEVHQSDAASSDLSFDLELIANAGAVITLGSPIVLPNGNVQLSFNTFPGRSYQVEWSNDLTSWQAAGPAIGGTGSRLTWIDSGPPGTPSTPQSTSRRFFRVVAQAP